MKADQTIDFQQIEEQIATNTLVLSASASSGLAVSFAVESGPATIADGTNLSFTGGGAVSVVASQGGDANWNPASDVTNTFDVLAVYTLTMGSESNGSTSPQAGTHSYVDGVTVQVSATPIDYHHFVAWLGDVPAGNETDNPLSVTMDGDRAITPMFAANVTAGSPVPVPESWLAQYGVTNNFEEAALNDSDGDGMLGWEEYVAGTDPGSHGSSLRLAGVGFENESFVLEFMSREGRLYTIEAIQDVGGDEWMVVEGNILGIDATRTVIEGSLPNMRFYRLKVELQGDVP